MQPIIKPLLAGLAAAALLSGCASYDYGYSGGYYGYSDPYYGYASPYGYGYGSPYGYGYGYGTPYYYDNGPYYYGYGPSYYIGPSVGFDLRFHDHDHHGRREAQHNGHNQRHYSQRGAAQYSQRNTDVRPAPTAQRTRAPITDGGSRMTQRPVQRANSPLARSDGQERDARARQRETLRAEQQ